MAENELHDVILKSETSDSQTNNYQPEIPCAQVTGPPPGYTVPQYPYYPPQHRPGQQGYFGPQPQAGQGYGQGYQPLVNQPQSTSNATTTNTTVVVQQPCVVGVIRPYNYLVQSILNTFFCCPLLGIIGIIFSCMVDSAFDDGDYPRARTFSTTARSLNIVAVVAGILFFLCVIGAQIHYRSG